ncbi:nuclear transport factor 2 family protein [Nocardia sp. NPDC051570]|uniref:nuclear transport factor 2 family protein n=1 Tax=Nocardia sp. NPDC051570 TaxID=3364324 RepID=UPI0037A848E0
MTDLEQNKKTVHDFFVLAFNDKQPAEAADRYLGPGYVQHNPQIPDGPAAFVEFVSGLTTQVPELRYDIKRLIAEGDLVVVHSLITTSSEDRGAAVVDIVRVRDGKLVEHWDVVQPVPEATTNDNTMF